MKTNRVVSDVYFFASTLLDLQDQGLIEGYVSIDPPSKVPFYLMMESRWNGKDGKLQKLPKYVVSQKRLIEISSWINHWDAEQKDKAIQFYNAYHGNR